jgi:hypothetical protein
LVVEGRVDTDIAAAQGVMPLSSIATGGVAMAASSASAQARSASAYQRMSADASLIPRSSFGYAPYGATGTALPPTRELHRGSQHGAARGTPMSYHSRDSPATSRSTASAPYGGAPQQSYRYDSGVPHYDQSPGAARALDASMESRVRAMESTLSASERTTTSLTTRVEGEASQAAEARGFVNQNWQRLELHVESRMSRHLERLQHAEAEDRQEIRRHALHLQLGRTQTRLDELAHQTDRHDRRVDGWDQQADRHGRRSRSRSPESESGHRPYNPYRC